MTVASWRAGRLARFEEVCYCRAAARGKIVARSRRNMEKHSLDERRSIP